MAVWMKTLVVIVFVWIATMQSVSAQASVVGKIGEESTEVLGPCECGVFSSKELTNDQQPITKNNPLNITCPADDSCSTMCVALAMAIEPKGPELLCAQIDDINDLYVSIFTRTCNDTEWKYTGVSCNKPYCCHDKKPIPCKNTPAAQVQPTATASSVNE